jgi:hypothetical protein
MMLAVSFGEAVANLRDLPRKTFEAYYTLWCSSRPEALSGTNGAGYRGCQNITQKGYQCQAWDSQFPQAHANTPANKPGAGLEFNNFCRNPDGAKGIW